MKQAKRLAAILSISAAVMAAGAVSASGNRPTSPSEVSSTSPLGRVAAWRAGTHQAGGGERWELCVSGPRQDEPRLVYRAMQSPVDVAGGRMLAWSPDGSSLLFVSAVAGRSGSRIFVVREDGSGLRCLSPMSRSEFDPCWSPDGKTIAFLQSDPSVSTLRSVWTMRADGSGRQRVAEDAAVPVASAGVPVLRWAENGSKLQWRAQPLFVSHSAAR